MAIMMVVMVVAIMMVVIAMAMKIVIVIAISMVLLGNKGDMVHLRQVSSEEGDQMVITMGYD